LAGYLQRDNWILLTALGAAKSVCFNFYWQSFNKQRY